MRVGSFCKILRHAEKRSLRELANQTKMPHSTIAALESGWLMPSVNTVSPLLMYIANAYPQEKYKVLAKYLSQIFLNEYAIRSYMDNIFCSPSWYASGILGAFFDRDRKDYAGYLFVSGVHKLFLGETIPMDTNEREMEDLIYLRLTSMIIDDLLRAGELTLETKFKLLVWLLIIGNIGRVKMEDVLGQPLSRPLTKTHKILDLLPPMVSRTGSMSFKLSEWVESFIGSPNLVPDPHGALDVMLLLSERVDLNPMNPGEASSTIITHSGKMKKVTCYYPPLANIPEIGFAEPSQNIEEMHL